MSPSVWTSLGFFRPPATAPVAIHGTAPDLKPGTVVRVLSWNLQFCAGRRCWFFYDGGPDSRVHPTEVKRTLDGVVDRIRSHDPDIVLLQEVDRRSTRTGGIDQHRVLAERLGLPVHVSTPYFRVPYVPVPPQAPLGRVDMHLSVFSKFGMANATRIALSPLDEPRWRRAFNLRRCLLRLRMNGSAGLDLLHTHLSAFSRQDGTLRKQVATLQRNVQRTGGPLVLAGDFNSLPPDDDPRRLGEASVLYDDTTPIGPLYDSLQSALPKEASGTYVPWGSMQPDRTIDYVFTREVEVLNAIVDPEGARWSDHLPLVVDLSV